MSYALILLSLILFGCTTASDLRKEALEKNAIGDFHGAIQAYEKAIEKDKTDFDAWMGLGWQILNQARFQETEAARNETLNEARRRFIVAMVLRPGLLEPLRALAIASQESKDAKACNEYWTKAKQLGAKDDPRFAQGCSP
jgi:Flp pilus assembly protein TadD